METWYGQKRGWRMQIWKTRLFANLWPLLESIGSSGQIEEKALRQSVSYLKQGLEDEDVLGYSLITGEEIVTDI